MAAITSSVPPTAPKEIPPVLVKVARSLETPGDISDAVQVGSTFHVLKLEEVIPPKDVSFADAKERLKPWVRRQKVERRQQPLLKELIDKAEIKYTNPVIRAQDRRSGKHDEQ